VRPEKREARVNTYSGRNISDGLMPCEILKLMAAAIASQPRHPAFVVRWPICSAPSPRIFNYSFGFLDHIVGIFRLVTFGVLFLRSDFSS
jgi:hypothetical protein